MDQIIPGADKDIVAPLRKRITQQYEGEGALAIEIGADATDIGATIHPHPTLAETLDNGRRDARGHHHRPHRVEETALNSSAESLADAVGAQDQPWASAAPS